MRDLSIHTEGMDITVTGIEHLQEIDVSRFEHIINSCNSHDGTSYEFDSGDDCRNPGDRNYFLLQDSSGTPLAAAFLFAPRNNEAEVYAFTLPGYRRRGFMNLIMGQLIQEMHRRAVSSLLFVCDSRCTDAAACVRSRNSAFKFSEYSMVWEPPLLSETKQEVSLRRAVPQDLERLTEINSEAFGEDPESTAEMLRMFLTSQKRDFYTITLPSGEIAGMIGRYLEEKKDYIHGFAVDSRLRGKGYGRQALLQMVELCRKADPSRSIALEVETENENALTLYTRCGFRVVSRFDYYCETI